MTNETVVAPPIAGRFRPESASHFKEVAKNIAWLLKRPLSKCKEDLSRIYGYSGLHELQEVLKKPGTPGPFAPRYDSAQDSIVESQESRVFFFLFGTFKSYWRDDHLADDKEFLVFEMGLFQEASEHRACVEKIKHALSLCVLRKSDRWPLIHGFPVGLRSWLAAGYTEPYVLADNWQTLLPRSRFAPMVCADVSWQRRVTGLVRLETIFGFLAPRVGGRKPIGMARVPFSKFDTEGGGIDDTSWEAYFLEEWLSNKLSKSGHGVTPSEIKLLQAFIQRPSKATASACYFVKDLEDPVGFRDRWAFECFKDYLARSSVNGKSASIASAGAGCKTTAIRMISSSHEKKF